MRRNELRSEKRCGKCGLCIPVSGFYRDARAGDGLQSRCKECVTKREKAIRQKRKDDPAQRKSWAEYQRKWLNENPERAKSIQRKSWAKYPNRTKEWKREKPSKVRASKQRRRALEIVGKNCVSAALMAEWINAQPLICHWCFKPCAGKYHIDHIQPLSRGGRHQVNNLCISCPPCNLSKGAKDPHVFVRGNSK